jgi:hypothetical protein
MAKQICSAAVTTEDELHTHLLSTVIGLGVLLRSQQRLALFDLTAMTGSAPFVVSTIEGFGTRLAGARGLSSPSTSRTVRH